jgi:hypothetical protein
VKGKVQYHEKGKPAYVGTHQVADKTEEGYHVEKPHDNEDIGKIGRLVLLDAGIVILHKKLV